MKIEDNKEEVVNTKAVWLSTFFRFKDDIEETVKYLIYMVCLLTAIDIALMIGWFVLYSR